MTNLKRVAEGVGAWLLHRFGPDTPEGREGQTLLKAAESSDEPTAEPHVIKQIEHALDDCRDKIDRGVSDYIRGCIADYRQSAVKSTVKCNACGSTEPEKYDPRFVKHRDWCPCRAGNQ